MKTNEALSDIPYLCLYTSTGTGRKKGRVGYLRLLKIMTDYIHIIPEITVSYLPARENHMLGDIHIINV